MIFDFHLPDVGEGISEAVLLEWFVAVGEQVAEGQDLAALTTDKVDFEVPSPRAGVIVELNGSAGQTLAVGSVLARIRVADTDEPASEPAPPPVATAAPAPAPAPQPARAPGVVAAPATRKLAADLGIALETVAGTGPNGEIRREDVERAAGPGGAEPGDPIPPLRQAMAARMRQSAAVYVVSTLDFRIVADPLQALAARLAADPATRVSLTALIARGLCAVLTRHPRLNATNDEAAQRIRQHRSVNLGVALAGDRGLVVPVLKGADALPLPDLAARLADLAARGRAGRLDPAETAGGTFTLSNTGPLERATLTAARPVIVPPQSAILWVSRVTQQPVVRDGQLAVGAVLHASLSFDHRYIDGADAIGFINDLTGALEAPEALV